MTRRTSGPSGRHSNPRRQLSQSEAAWKEQDALAAREGKTWAEWARERLQLGCLECLKLDWECHACAAARPQRNLPSAPNGSG